MLLVRRYIQLCGFTRRHEYLRMRSRLHHLLTWSTVTCKDRQVQQVRGLETHQNFLTWLRAEDVCTFVLIHDNCVSTHILSNQSFILVQNRRTHAQSSTWGEESWFYFHRSNILTLHWALFVYENIRAGRLIKSVLFWVVRVLCWHFWMSWVIN